jgi:spermidine/putrescine-binding protein
MTKRARVALATTALALALGFGVADGTAQQPLRVVHYGGTADKLLRDFCFGPAERAIGVKIVDMSRTDYAKIKAMVEAKNIEWDVALVNTLLVKRAMKENLFEPIDWTVIDPKVQGAIPRLDTSVTYLTYSQGLARLLDREVPRPGQGAEVVGRLLGREEVPQPARAPEPRPLRARGRARRRRRAAR